MKTDTPTPRTNAAEVDMSSDTLKIHTRFVQADFARQLERELSNAGKPTDAADPNGSAYARLKWWHDRTDDLHDQLAAKDAHADEIYKAAVDLAKKLEDDLAAERALADRLAGELSACKNTFGIEFGGTTEALAAWKEARRDP
jgi:hypothetical protein